ncbi:MAG: NAD(+) synthase [Endomicrobiaceae bacterium]
MITEYGFIRVCACAPRIKIADIEFNTKQIITEIKNAKKENASVILFPELSITGYTCGDLFQQDSLLKKAEEALDKIALETEDIIAVVGLPVYHESRLWNVAAVIANGKKTAFIPKSYIPSYKEYYERRWFHSGFNVDSEYKKIIFNPNTLLNISIGNFLFKAGIEICEDLWMPIPPSSRLALMGATLILNPSASTETIGKAAYRRELINQNSARNVCSYLYAASGPTESTSDVVFSGHCMASEYGIITEETELYQRDGARIITDFDINKMENERRKFTSFGDQIEHFSNMTNIKTVEISLNTEKQPKELNRYVDSTPFEPKTYKKMKERTEEILNIQVNGLMTRLENCGTKGIVIGVSGGLDSTLALLVAVRAIDKLGWNRKAITGITMPGFGTTDKTKNNAVKLMDELGIDKYEVSIIPACLQHFKDIEISDADRSVTYENSQARERTQILMDYANKTNKIVLGTGDMSEIALGFCTYNADHMSMYNVNCSVPKTLVKYLVKQASLWKELESCRETLESICNTAISPELLPPDEKGEISQKTEHIIGPYELHDFFLYNHIRWNFTPKKIFYLARNAFKEKYDDTVIKKWLNLFYKRFFNAQFKRNCVPDGPKVGSISLSPRGDWRMPSDASSNDWIK